ncbi:MAG: trigger factor [Candidatus Eisenbacteria bacterium]|nr:trigger factor [Candidatus Eisenbacteria bacterium]
MTHTVRESGSWQHTITVEIPVEEVESRLGEVARTLQKRVSMPGFRKGKVPLERVRSDFASYIEQEFLEHVLPEATGRAMSEASLSPILPPKVTNVRFTPGQPLTFEAVVDVTPQVEVGRWKALPLVRRTRVVDDAAVDAMVEDLREQSAVFVDVDRPAGKGDVVLLDSQRLDARDRRLANTRAKNTRIQLGAPELLPDLENGLAGAQAGQERTLTVQYPADYRQAELAGKTMRYVLSIRKIQEKKLREPDDNFARELFKMGSMAELRDRVRQNLEAEDAGRVRRELESQASEELIRLNPFELSPRLVDYMLHQLVHEQTGGREVGEELSKQLEEHYRPGVERSLRRELLLAGIARQESLTVSDEEIAADIERMCTADPRQASRIRARYQSAERRRSLGETLVERKAMDRLIEAAQLRDEPLAAPAPAAAS